ncbi:hypothetical protein CDL15_Pgr022792 [Punica granatum]|uniref:Bifunctional inhibitor/plant lipid transfer protein/seed storage helical domain-containing protein n=1 Tax=Punica granatum TaxID=22663 RepID=A0A218XST7_PUNGR|nr:hypothetical protein CDL15_Pgr022792 [Punica granatum]
MALGGKKICGKWVFGFLVIAVITSSRATADIISCGDAIAALIPCEAFLLGSSLPTPSSDCCSGARNLESMANTVEKRRALCQCFEQTSPSFGVKPDRVNSLPLYCKLKITLPAEPHYDCSKYINSLSPLCDFST